MSKSKASIIITNLKNEQIPILLQAITTAFKRSGIEHEIIPADGFIADVLASARYPHILVMNADIEREFPQYPELMVQMLNVSETLDLDVTTTLSSDAGIAQKFLSWMHRLNIDSGSPLVYIRTSALSKLSLHQEKGLDLSFFLQAKHAGLKVLGLPLGGSYNRFSLFFDSLRTRLRGPAVLKLSGSNLRKKGRGFTYKGAEFVHHADLHAEETALRRFGGRQIEFLIVVAVLFAIAMAINWHATILIMFASLTFLYFADLLFNLFLIIRSFTTNPELKVSEEQVNARSQNWPRYTVFCPLYKEWQVIPQFVTAMSKLDYPKDKLQVMLLLEEDDKQSIEKTAEFDLPDYFQVVVVPHSMPKTKPKALNYGLTKATGEYIVIYDAEDVPDPLQLKKAVVAFEKLGPKTICVQAKLNFYNPHQNILTRVFTAEYSLWFDLVLPGMQSIAGPIPLGGTSNHFRTKDVSHLRGWDAFNVTEDCDLGIRLAKHGYQTAIIESTTMEEANSHFWNWLSQRSRWIKGYIQTYLVHMRNPREFITKNKGYHLIAFQFIVGGKILSMFINPLMWCVTIVYFVFRGTAGPIIESFFPSIILYIGVFSFIFGNFLYLYYYMIACAKRGHFDLIKYVFVVPFYWLMMSFAAWRAVYEMIVKPHYWAKTVHGLHLKKTEEPQPHQFMPKPLRAITRMERRED